MAFAKTVLVIVVLAAVIAGLYTRYRTRGRGRKK